MQLLGDVGGSYTPSIFLRGGAAYVLCVDGEPVGHGYEYPYSALAKWFGPGVTYIGKLYVRPEWRGKGIAGLMVQAMVATLAPGGKAILEVHFENLSSQRSLLKAGARLVGRLHTLSLFARLVRVRIDPA
jgi:GNAT superfamily N-acetyltransferase